MSFLGSLVSGVFGLFGKKEKKQETVSRVDYGRMVADATAAGFNPLTAIRNGGSAGFTTTTSPTISQTPEVLSNLGGILGDALDEKLDPIKAKKRELDTLLVDQQLRQLKQGPQIPASFKVPRTYTGTKVSQQLVPRVGPSANKTAAVPAATGSGPNGQILPTHTQWRTRTGELVWLPNPDLPDIEQYPMPWLGNAEKQLTEPPKTAPQSPWKKPFYGFGKAYEDISTKPITVRPATKSEDKANKESWHGGWLPSFGLKWN